jgi:hypothetical protein
MILNATYHQSRRKCRSTSWPSNATRKRDCH